MTAPLPDDTLTAALFSKILVDIAKISPLPTPGRILPLLAVLLSIVLVGFFAWTALDSLDKASLGEILKHGIQAGAQAVGMTELQNRGATMLQGFAQSPSPPQFPPSSQPPLMPPSPPTGGVG